MRRVFSSLLALVLVLSIGLTGCSSPTPSGLSGNYNEDTVAVIESLRTALGAANGTPEQAEAQAQARQTINDFAGLYRREPSLQDKASFRTMQTALNALAGHYSSYGNRPVPKKLQDRLEQEFKQVEAALRRGA
ncbi:MAG: photosystem II protein Psb27 [Merismopedia sp. SIO2A8]|nr:photosystem II protein Psb27 [Merismopedia sp. SIO2A8]